MKELFSALAKAQGEFKPAVFDCENPHYRSKYASLASVVESVRGSLSKYGLSFSQSVESISTDGKIFLFTSLYHSSGEYIVNKIPVLLVKQDMQGLGSAITYAKRYGLSAMLGVVADADDDGNLADDKNEKKDPPKQQKPIEPAKQQKISAAQFDSFTKKDPLKSRAEDDIPFDFNGPSITKPTLK